MAKETRGKIMAWLTETGVEGWLGIVIGIILLLMGHKLGAGIAIGFFLCKNWEWIKEGIKEFIDKKMDKSEEQDKFK